MKTATSRAPEMTRRKILEAAFNEFYKRGFQGGSINRIVDQAGTTKGALFHHFKGKNDLGYAVVREVIHPHLREKFADPLANSTDPITDLKRLFLQSNKREIANDRLVHGCPLNNLAQEMSPLDERFRKALAKIYAGLRESLAAAFAHGIKAGTVRKNISPSKVATFVVAAHAGICGTAKNAQSEKLLVESSQALFDYLDSLKP
jgi:TetR/AcrR family transcriptional regulator, transcriptional repressor for nem operon